jgi:hypothetical protein
MHRRPKEGCDDGLNGPTNEKIKNAVMRMGGGDGACSDRTDVKTSQDGSAFVVTDAIVARAWCTFRVVRGRSVLNRWRRSYSLYRSLVQFFDDHSVFAPLRVSTPLDRFRKHNRTLLNKRALRSRQCWGNNDAGGAGGCRTLLRARGIRNGRHSTTLRTADGDRK